MIPDEIMAIIGMSPLNSSTGDMGDKNDTFLPA
jgi:hypothetical protein